MTFLVEGVNGETICREKSNVKVTETQLVEELRKVLKSSDLVQKSSLYVSK